MLVCRCAKLNSSYQSLSCITSSEFHGRHCVSGTRCHWIMDTLPLLPILLSFLPGLLGILLARVPLDYEFILVSPPHCAVVNVRELNWMSDWPIQDNRGDCRDPENFCWSKQDFEQVKSASFIFAAAHVIYSDDLTIALFRMLRRVMTFGCDKHWRNDTTSALMIVANGYTCFRSYVKEDATGELENRSFVGKRIDVTQIPQYLKGYDRGDDVELWEIKYVL